MPGLSTKAGTSGYDFDPEMAEVLLTAADVTLPLKIELQPKDEPTPCRTCEVIQARLARAGIKLSLGLTPVANWIKKARGGAGDLNLMKYIFSEADIRHSTFHSTGSLSFVRQDPEHLDAKLALQRELADPAERQALLDELQSTIMSDAYWKPLHGPPDFTPVSSSVLDAQMDSRGVIWPELLSMTVLRPCCACLQRGWSVPD